MCVEVVTSINDAFNDYARNCKDGGTGQGGEDDVRKKGSEIILLLLCNIMFLVNRRTKTIYHVLFECISNLNNTVIAASNSPERRAYDR